MHIMVYDLVKVKWHILSSLQLLRVRIAMTCGLLASFKVMFLHNSEKFLLESRGVDISSVIEEFSGQHGLERIDSFSEEEIEM